MAKQRLDHMLALQHPELSKSFIQSMIMQGKVRVDGQVISKSGTMINEDAVIEMIDDRPKYVSRAGFKLEHALAHFDCSVQGLTVLDAGLSTGGSTDCLLQHGVAKVYGVDVGYGQVHERIASDPRVIVMERTNLRHLKSLPELVDLVTLGLSFISVLKVIERVAQFMKPGAKLIVLIKPQFEAGKQEVGRGGIVKDEVVHEMVIKKVIEGITKEGFECQGVTTSPILGGEGNKEFLALLVKK